MAKTYFSIAAILTIFITLITPFAFAGDCLRLCEQDFMQNATAQDIRDEINRGADVRGRTEDGTTPLHSAPRFGSIETVTFLRRHGAQIEARMKSGATALHAAAYEGNIKTISSLLDAGADIEAKTAIGITPLHYATERGNIQSIRILLKNHANTDAQTYNTRATPLHIIAQKKQCRDWANSFKKRRQ